MRRRLGLIAMFVVPAALGCGSLGSSEPARSPSMLDDAKRCKVAASHENPLVTEWPSADKANLEALARSGAVFVQYSGCSMRLLPECRAPGAYRFRRTTTTTDFVEVQDTDELFAKLPLGAASLEGELERSGRLAVQTTVSGQLELDRFDGRRVDSDPRCQSATHVIRGVAVGAFNMQSGDQYAARGGASVSGLPASASGASSRSTGLLRAAGDPGACKLATEDEPHPDCRSPVQVFLSPLPRTTARLGPPGTLNVRFVPPDSDSEWKLAVGDRELCPLPCQRRVDPELPYTYRTEGGFLRPDYVEDLPDLRPHADAGEIEVRPTPRKSGRLAWGVVMTSVGGAAMLTGVTLLAVNCGRSTGGCVAGAITAPAGALLLAPGIYFIVTSGSKLEVFPASLPVGQNMDGEPIR